MKKFKAGYKSKYWFVDVVDGSYLVKEAINHFTLKDISRLSLGNMFPTQEQATAMVGRICENV